MLDPRAAATEPGKEPAKKPNIVKDYVCLRNGELCHPDYARNRGMFVSCSNGVAWEQQCPKCAYHPLNCPTKSLWFDGEKCDWASPKLASQPCLDKFPGYEAATVKNGPLDEQELLLKKLQRLYGPAVVAAATEAKVETSNKIESQSAPVPVQYFKSPKLEAGVEEAAEVVQEIDSDFVSGEEAKEVKAVDAEVVFVDESDSAAVVADDDDNAEAVNNIEGKSASSESSDNSEVESESEFPSFLSAEDSQVKIVKLTEPVYTLVNNPDGSGKQVLMRVTQPFVLGDNNNQVARTGLFSLNSIRAPARKH